jgi:hypothetical protein
MHDYYMLRLFNLSRSVVLFLDLLCWQVGAAVPVSVDLSAFPVAHAAEDFSANAALLLRHQYHFRPSSCMQKGTVTALTSASLCASSHVLFLLISGQQGVGQYQCMVANVLGFVSLASPTL